MKRIVTELCQHRIIDRIGGYRCERLALYCQIIPEKDRVVSWKKERYVCARHLDEALPFEELDNRWEQRHQARVAAGQVSGRRPW